MGRASKFWKGVASPLDPHSLYLLGLWHENHCSIESRKETEEGERPLDALVNMEYFTIMCAELCIAIQS